MVAFKQLNIRKLFQVHHLENHECTDRTRIGGIFHQKAFLSSVLPYWDSPRTYLGQCCKFLWLGQEMFARDCRRVVPKSSGPFQNCIWNSLYTYYRYERCTWRLLYKICKQSEERGKREKATILHRMTNTALVVIQRRYATWAALKAGFTAFQRNEDKWVGEVLFKEKSRLN